MPDELQKWIKSVDERLSNHISEVLPIIAETRQDVKWLKKFFFMAVSPILGTIVLGVVYLVFTI